MKKIRKLILQKLGKNQNGKNYSDFEVVHKEIIDQVFKYTMTSPERLFALIEAVRYLCMNKIEGSFVECGVWKGGSSMAMALSLLKFGNSNRDIYLYDTFEGMSEPGQEDVSSTGMVANVELTKREKSTEDSLWAYAPLEGVKKILYSTHYPKERIHFIQGKVEETLIETKPNKISFLRLDTDWYESTKEELNHLFPRLVEGGVLLIDDYGHWKGARKAVDEYIKNNNISILLNRIDYTGRIGVKNSPIHR